jgi:hypothetical protein
MRALVGRGTYYQNLLTGADTSGTLDHWNARAVRSGSLF